MANLKQLPMVKRGDTITARFLSDIARNLNTLSGAGEKKSSNQRKLVDGETVNQKADEETEKIEDDRFELPLANHVWTEFSRFEEEVRVFDPDDEDVYVDVGRMRIVRSRNLLGEEEFRVFEDGTG